jgi:hypothetical protein
MKTLSHVTPFLLLACLFAVPAAAQTVYRCGNSYSQQPCPGGSAIDASDSRTPEQRRTQEATVRHERRVADRLEQERLKEEAAAARAAREADQAQRNAEKAARPTGSKTKSAAGKDKLPAYRAPLVPAQK